MSFPLSIPASLAVSIPVFKRSMLFAALVLLLQLPGTSYGHTMAPVLVTIKESITKSIAQNKTKSSDSHYHVLWSFSRDTGAVDPASLSLGFTPSCSQFQHGLVRTAGNRWLREEQYDCGTALNESLSVAVRGLESVERSVAVRVVDSDNNEQVHLLNEHSSTLLLSHNGSSQGVFGQYARLGVQHILEGADHVVFVIALCFLAGGRVRTLIGLITAFTVAHSITLSVAVLGWVNLPARPVEALIALSIALVAADLVRNSGDSQRRFMRYWPVVFVFGLLHGLGFAGALMELGLPQAALITALLSFNVGVELGQLGLVAMCALLIQVVTRIREPRWLNPAVGVGIGCTAGFWFVSRVV